MQRLSDKEILSLVKEEIKLCVAPISGILVATAFITDQGLYLGHNLEHENPVVFEHGEMMALKKMLAAEPHAKIKKIVMAGGGNVTKLKFYTPCFPCCNTLLPYVSAETIIVLSPRENMKEPLVITFAELWQSYAQLPYSKITAQTKEEIQTELKSKTPLDPIDLDFVVDLTLFGISENISFYLTASASGRGGVSTMLNAKTNHKYRDIDIIAVITKDFEQIEKRIEAIILRHYKTFSKENKVVPEHHNKKGVVFKKSFYYCEPSKNTLIDFTFSTDLVGALAKNEYEVKNWFHQLS